MPEQLSISLKRQLLADFRIRFAPETQESREKLIDSFVEHSLYTPERGEGSATNDIQDNLHTILKVNIGIHEISSSLERLIANEKVEPYEETIEGIKVKGGKRRLYRLLSTSSKDIEKLERESTNRFNSVCRRLFKETGQEWKAYSEPFFKFLASIFSRLAGENYRMIRGELPSYELTSTVAFKSALKSVKKDLKSLDTQLFENAIENFFRSPDPEYASIKWNMAQNYYALRVIGLADHSLLLSRESFTNAEFYLDTNVVISALEPREAYHKAFISLCNVCENLGVRVKVCKETLEELDRVVKRNRETIENVIDQIPEETKYKVSSDFFEAYVEKTKTGEPVNIDAIFENFMSVEDKLRDRFKVTLEDNQWFEQVREEKEIQDFAKDVANRYIKMASHGKGELAAKHDAMCLLWVERLRKRTKNDQNIWFVTRDHTLPGCLPPNCAYDSLAITLDALIQWLSPMDVETNSEELALAYSEVICSRVLPRERLFDLDDFVIFHELEMTCKALPPEDVEGCIRYLKQSVPLLNPTIPADREKLARRIAIYFADPSRKYKEDKERYEAEISSLRSAIERETRISLKRDAWLKLTHIGIGLIFVEAIVCLIIALYGRGDNAFQRIISSWSFLTISPVACIPIGWFYLGKQKIKALGWPMTKIFKEE